MQFCTYKNTWWCCVSFWLPIVIAIQSVQLVFAPRWWPFDALEQNIYIYIKTMQFHSSPLSPKMSRSQVLCKIWVPANFQLFISLWNFQSEQFHLAKEPSQPFLEVLCHFVQLKFHRSKSFKNRSDDEKSPETCQVSIQFKLVDFPSSNMFFLPDHARSKIRS